MDRGASPGVRHLPVGVTDADAHAHGDEPEDVNEDVDIGGRRRGFVHHPEPRRAQGPRRSADD